MNNKPEPFDVCLNIIMDDEWTIDAIASRLQYTILRNGDNVLQVNDDGVNFNGVFVRLKDYSDHTLLRYLAVSRREDEKHFRIADRVESITELLRSLYE